MIQRKLVLMVVMLLGLTVQAQELQSYDQFFMEAMVQRQKGNNDAAFDLLRHCQELNPDAPEVYFFLGQYYSLLKNPEKSIDCVKRAAALNPENEIYMETLAQTYIRQQDYASAIPVLEGIYARNKDREDMLEMLFQLYQQVEDYQQAVGVLNRLEMIDGKSERLSLAKREIYARMGDKKAAVAEMEALAKQYPHDLNYLAMYGESLMMNGQAKKALNIYHQVLKEEPDNNRVLMSLRTYYQSQGNRIVADSLTERVLLNKNATPEEKVHLLRQEVASSDARPTSDRGGYGFLLCLLHECETNAKRQHPSCVGTGVEDSTRPGGSPSATGGLCLGG